MAFSICDRKGLGFLYSRDPTNDILRLLTERLRRSSGAERRRLAARHDAKRPTTNAWSLCGRCDPRSFKVAPGHFRSQQTFLGLKEHEDFNIPPLAHTTLHVFSHPYIVTATSPNFLFYYFFYKYDSLRQGMRRGMRLMRLRMDSGWKDSRRIT
jgi:hypothetical protein